MSNRYTIGRLARETGVKVTTIRYYESVGLMAEPARTEAGQRIYDAAAVIRLGFIRHARDLGFPTEAIRSLIRLQHLPADDCTLADAIAREQLEAVRGRIAQLRGLEDELQRIVSACAGGVVGECAVLQSLANHSTCLSEEHLPPERGMLR